MAASTDIIAELSLRLRDPGVFAYPGAVLLRLIDHVQRLLMLHQVAAIATATTNSNGGSSGAFHPIIDTSSQMGGIVRIRQSGRTLPYTPSHSLAQTDDGWILTPGRRLRTWAQIGRDHFVFSPRQTPTDFDVEILRVVRTFQPVNDGSEDMVLPDEYIPMLKDLVEALALLRGKRFSEAGEPVQRFMQTVAMLTGDTGEE